jgi:DNA-binding LacI/PurR family transcriptional regulator
MTTISQSGVEMGRMAGEMLFDMIARQASRDDVADIVMAPTLVVRESAAPVAAAGRPPPR